MSQTPCKITAVLTARAGKSDELGTLLVGMAPLCRDEPGNLRWDVWRDPSHDGRYVLDELYRDAAAVEAHRNSPHYQAYLTKIPDLADRSICTPSCGSQIVRKHARLDPRRCLLWVKSGHFCGSALCQKRTFARNNRCERQARP